MRKIPPLAARAKNEKDRNDDFFFRRSAFDARNKRRNN